MIMIASNTTVDKARARQLLSALHDGLSEITGGSASSEWEALGQAMDKAEHGNGWFSPTEVRHAATVWSRALAPEAVERWLESMSVPSNDRQPVTVGIVMAGNIPFVGLHDLLCAVVSGHQVKVKPSRDDAGLTAALIGCWAQACPGLNEQVSLETERLDGFDAVIATGSRNSGRYFQHYFGGVPHIIRGQRTSVAVLDGSETHEQMQALSEDIFRYFGLGCRNVTQVFVPRDFDLNRLFAAFVDWTHLGNHHRFYNNYTYHKALWLMEAVDLLENGFVLLKEDEGWVSPVGALHYQRYDDIADVEQRIDEGKEHIQCRVGNGGLPFGEAQCPGLSDYADGVDTMAFLLGLGG
jgi:hypothetical protein